MQQIDREKVNNVIQQMKLAKNYFEEKYAEADEIKRTLEKELAASVKKGKKELKKVSSKIEKKTRKKKRANGWIILLAGLLTAGIFLIYYLSREYQRVHSENYVPTGKM